MAPVRRRLGWGAANMNSAPSTIWNSDRSNVAVIGTHLVIEAFSLETIVPTWVVVPAGTTLYVSAFVPV